MFRFSPDLHFSRQSHRIAKRNVTCVNVLSVTSEIFPLIKTGGLADVIGALP